MQRILVTGGAGFLGSHLCDRLVRDGHEVICFDNLMTGRRENLAHLRDQPRFELVLGDVGDPFHIDVDRVYHLACPASPVHYQRDPVRTIETAVVGTHNALELARRAGARILLASTSEVYGDPKEHPQVEGYLGNVDSVGERSCYDEGKRCAEALAAAYAREHGTEIRIARIFNTYGPRMHERDGRVISNLIVQALAGEPLIIHGTGQQTRSFCYVSDLVDGLIRLMEHHSAPGPVNLGNPEELRIVDLARLVIDMSGRSGRGPARLVREPARSGDPARRCPDITRARELLGWTPAVPLGAGLATTIDYFAARMHPSEDVPSTTPMAAVRVRKEQRV